MTPQHSHWVDPRQFILDDDGVQDCRACRWLRYQADSGILVGSGHMHPRPFSDCDYCKTEGRVAASNTAEKVAETFTAVECVLAFVRWHRGHVPNGSLTAADEFYTELTR